MLQADVVMVLSWVFAPVSREDWESVSNQETWGDFIAAVEPHVAPESREALENLKTPPTYDEKRQFAALHFTGGLPASAQPIESLYVPSEDTGVIEYCGKSARYMRDLIESFGSQVPPSFSDCPDHLSLELEIAAHLLRHDPESARDFMSGRFGWLDAYEKRLLSIKANASFYAAAVRVTGDIVRAWCK